MIRRLAAVLLFAAPLLAGLVLATATPAGAHPLGNFSVNHYHGLVLHPDRVDDFAVLDEAEIPTLQVKSTVDSDGDGTITEGERSSFAVAGCRDLARGFVATVDGRKLSWIVIASDFTLRQGAANLQTGRTECRLTAAADLHRAATVEIADNYRSDRVGWRELTASGSGVGLTDPAVPRTSVSDELRRYPDDLLASPLDQRSVTLHTTEATATTADTARPAIPMSGALGRGLNVLTNRFYAIAGSGDLGPAVGLLGIGLALLLGAAHAALPGHGKTVMAAYIAGRRGTIRDAITVGATVTATHTAGVLVLGLLLTLLAGLVGEIVLGWLGVASGLLIAGIGVGLLRSAISRRRSHLHDDTVNLPPAPLAAVRQPVVALVDSPASTTGVVLDSSTSTVSVAVDSPASTAKVGVDRVDSPKSTANAGVDSTASTTTTLDDVGILHDGHSAGSGARDDVRPAADDYPRGYSRYGTAHSDGAHSHEDSHDRHSSHEHSVHEHSVHGHSHDVHSHNGHSHLGHPLSGHSLSSHVHQARGWRHHDHKDTPLGRRGLIGMGIAGGLVPSPSALVVLLGAIALGHTWFGVLLVIAYGLGMAATLTAAGLTLVVLRRRMDRMASQRFGGWAVRLSAATPVLTAGLVLVVGIGLAVRGAFPLLG